MEKVYEFLKDCGTFFYATCEGDKPRVRPFGFLMVFEGKLYFGMGKQKPSFAQTIANSNIEICALNSKNVWVRVKGTAVLDDRDEVLQEAFKVSPFLTNLYNEQTGNKLGNFYIKDAVAEIADMAGNVETITF